MGTDLVEVEAGNGQKIYVEIERGLCLKAEQLGAQRGFATAGVPTPDQVIERFEKLAEYIAGRSKQFISQYQGLGSTLRPSKLAMEFAIGIEGSAGIPFLAGGKGSANITVKAEWDLSP